MFALESLASVGETYATSERVRRACQFFIDRQMEDGGWGESYESSDLKKWVNPREVSSRRNGVGLHCNDGLQNILRKSPSNEPSL